MAPRPQNRPQASSGAGWRRNECRARNHIHGTCGTRNQKPTIYGGAAVSSCADPHCFACPACVAPRAATAWPEAGSGAKLVDVVPLARGVPVLWELREDLRRLDGLLALPRHLVDLRMPHERA